MTDFIQEIIKVSEYITMNSDLGINHIFAPFSYVWLLNLDILYYNFRKCLRIPNVVINRVIEKFA